MFDGRRYSSPGINSTLPKELQVALWGLVDELKAVPGSPPERIQIFDLESLDLKEQAATFVKVTHRQGQSGYWRVHFILPGPVSNVRVLAIDAGEYSVLMLAREC